MGPSYRPPRPQLCALGLKAAAPRRSLQGHAFVSMEVPRVTEPLRIAAALSFAVARDDAGDGFTPVFKQVMAARLNGAPALPPPARAYDTPA